MANGSGNNGNSDRIYFGRAPKSLQMVTAIMRLKEACSLGKKKYNQPRQHIKKQRHYFANKYLSSQSCGFPVVMYRCESWTLKKSESMVLNFDVGEYSWESLGLQGNPTSPS